MTVSDHTGPSLRASDADREAAIAQLRDHVADGRLSMAEFEERIDEAHRARTSGELAHALRDLPGAGTTPAASTGEDRPSRRRRVEWALWRFGTVNGICVGIWAATGAHAFWPGFVLVPTGVIALRRVFGPTEHHGHEHAGEHTHEGHGHPAEHRRHHRQGPPAQRQATTAARRAVVSVLFLDVVESTRRAALLGDAAWRQLADRYERSAADVITACNGEVLFTRGDEVVAAFQLPADAVVAAQRIRSVTTDLGLQVRAGIHAGEVDRLGARAEGIVMHIGRRVCEAAAPGQVLVSSTVRDLLAGAGLTFTDAGERELKGLDGTWRVFEVVTGG